LLLSGPLLARCGAPGTEAPDVFMKALFGVLLAPAPL